MGVNAFIALLDQKGAASEKICVFVQGKGNALQARGCYCFE